ncbi:hypothetical protein FOZ61_010452 [Perkinsus olseni]|uniref:HAT C-terminal dimerisation domain-containing protein n=1 Tax=Perkinsus olseni TaxID=32597 RepID=A0A7J6KVU6_PEROL|nr:hypothetical protein FOZ61_010452 [Perkinsus olseni]
MASIDDMVEEKLGELEGLGYELSDYLPTRTNRRASRRVESLDDEMDAYMLKLRSSLHDRLLADIEPLITLSEAFSLDKNLRRIDYDFGPVAEFCGMASEKEDLRTQWRALCKDPDFDPFSMVFADEEVALHKNYCVMFSTIFKLCKRVLTIGCGSASAERTFSRVGRILSTKRSNLSQQHLQYLMTISSNGVEVPHPKSTSWANRAGELDAIIDASFVDFCKCPRRLCLDDEDENDRHGDEAL